MGGELPPLAPLHLWYFYSAFLYVDKVTRHNYYNFRFNFHDALCLKQRNR